jgi:hypothetical protein
MTERTKECEACFGTGNEARMRSPHPIRKITFRPCPTGKGAGKSPPKQNEWGEIFGARRFLGPAHQPQTYPCCILREGSMSKFAVGLLTLAMYAVSLPVIAMITPAEAATKKHWQTREPWYVSRAQAFVPPYSQAGPICPGIARGIDCRVWPPPIDEDPDRKRGGGGGWCCAQGSLWNAGKITFAERRSSGLRGRLNDAALDERRAKRTSSARSIGPCRDKGVVSDILAAASVAPDETDRASVAQLWPGTIEVTSSMSVAIKTRTTSACGVCDMPREQARKKERSGNKVKVRHKRLRAGSRARLMLDTTAARIDLRQWLLRASHRFKWPLCDIGSSGFFSHKLADRVYFAVQKFLM